MNANVPLNDRGLIGVGTNSDQHRHVSLQQLEVAFPSCPCPAGLPVRHQGWDDIFDIGQVLRSVRNQVHRTGLSRTGLYAIVSSQNLRRAGDEGGISRWGSRRSWAGRLSWCMTRRWGGRPRHVQNISGVKMQGLESPAAVTDREGGESQDGRRLDAAGIHYG